MATGFTGRINRVVSDGQITPEDFAEIERALFEGDGVVDVDEEIHLGSLFERANYLRGDIYLSINDPEDFLRLDLLANQKVRTLEQYLEQLGLSGLTPRNSLE